MKKFNSFAALQASIDPAAAKKNVRAKEKKQEFSKAAMLKKVQEDDCWERFTAAKKRGKYDYLDDELLRRPELFASNVTEI
jgi:hypothetical protein